MSTESYTLDTHSLGYAIDPAQGSKHDIAPAILDRSTERACILAVQALAEFVDVATRQGMRSRLEPLRRRATGYACFRA